jgi:hypothetical protein
MRAAAQSVVSEVQSNSCVIDNRWYVGIIAPHAMTPNWHAMHQQIPPQHQLPPSLNGYTRPHRSSTANGGTPPGYRVKWDNIAIIAVAVLACIIVVPMLLKLGSHKPGAPVKAAKLHRTDPDDGVVKSTMSLSQAQDLVEQARVAMNEGRFDDATALLSGIAGPVSDESGASSLRDQVARRMAEHDDLIADLAKAVETENWDVVLTTIAQIKSLAPLTQEQVGLAKQAALQLKAQDAYDKAMAAYERGDLREALSIATAANARFHTDALDALQDKLRAELRKRQSAADTDSAVDADIGSTSGGGGAGGAAATTSGGGHSHSTSSRGGGSASGGLGTAGAAGSVAGTVAPVAGAAGGTGGLDIQGLLNGILGQADAAGLNNIAIGGEIGGLE